MVLFSSGGRLWLFAAREHCRACLISVAFYAGLDCLSPILMLLICVIYCPRCGHRPVALLGGATGRVGDPSGRSTERPVLSEEEIEHNVQGVGLRRGGGARGRAERAGLSDEVTERFG